jgi:hypothetical protein
MNETKPLTQTQVSIGDAAVDGLIHGAVAGVVMVAYLVVVALLSGEGPLPMLARFDLGGGASPLTGGLMHLAVSGVYGIGFALIRRLIGRRAPGWLAGLIFGAALFFVAEVIVLPGAASPLRAIPALHFAIAHGLYGLTLGVLNAKAQ